jgi:hypothetical protein
MRSSHGEPAPGLTRPWLTTYPVWSIVAIPPAVGIIWGLAVHKTA